MSWFLLALISITATSIATILARVLMKEEESNPVTTAIVFQFTLTFYVLIFALLLGRFVWPPADISPFRFLVSTLLWAGTTLFNLKGIKLLGAGESTILTSSSAVVSVILGVFLLKETISLGLIIGLILIFGAILVVNSERLSFKSRQGIIFALLTALFSGTAVVNDAYILQTYEAFSFTAIMSFLPGVVLAASFPKETTKVKLFLKKKELKLILLLGFFYSIQAVAYYLAFQKGAPISSLSTLTKAQIILTVVLATLFLKEQSNLFKKALATLMVTLGAILLS